MVNRAYKEGYTIQGMEMKQDCSNPWVHRVPTDVGLTLTLTTPDTACTPPVGLSSSASAGGPVRAVSPDR